MQSLHLTEETGPSFDWAGLVAQMVHPIRVGIIEAMLYLDRPLSAAELTQIFDQRHELSLISYHLVSLAKLKAVRKVRHRHVRGAVETFYALR